MLFGSVPLFAMPLIAIIWIFEQGPAYPFVYLSFIPVNILCTYVHIHLPERGRCR